MPITWNADAHAKLLLAIETSLKEKERHWEAASRGWRKLFGQSSNAEVPSKIAISRHLDALRKKVLGGSASRSETRGPTGSKTGTGRKPKLSHEYVAPAVDSQANTKPPVSMKGGSRSSSAPSQTSNPAGEHGKDLLPQQPSRGRGSMTTDVVQGHDCDDQSVSKWERHDSASPGVAVEDPPPARHQPARRAKLERKRPYLDDWSDEDTDGAVESDDGEDGGSDFMGENADVECDAQLSAKPLQKPSERADENSSQDCYEECNGFHDEQAEIGDTVRDSSMECAKESKDPEQASVAAYLSQGPDAGTGAGAQSQMSVPDKDCKADWTSACQQTSVNDNDSVAAAGPHRVTLDNRQKKRKAGSTSSANDVPKHYAKKARVWA